MIKLVAFLGNYGKEYEKTRHNVSWYFEDSLPFANKLSWQNKFKGEFASFTPAELSQWACDTKICSKKDGSPVLVPEEAPAHIYFLKPLTYMNLSGKAVKYWLAAEKIARENLLIVVDDIALPVGTLRMKKQGSGGGHNGLANIEEALGDSNYCRLRVGVGNNFSRGRQIDYVLGRFAEEELAVLEPKIERAAEAVRCFATQGADRAMNMYNE